MTMAAPWMTAGDPSDGEPSTFERPVFAYGFDRILRTSRCITAGGPQHGRQEQLVSPDQQQKETAQGGSDYLFPYESKRIHGISFSNLFNTSVIRLCINA